MTDRKARLLLSYGFIVGCQFGLVSCSVEVREIERIRSPDQNAVAVYKMFQYGGAAGSTEYCISIAATTDADDDDHNCMLVATDLGYPRLTWKGDVLVVEYFGARITEFDSNVRVELPSGKYESYHMRLVVNPDLGD